MKATDGDDLDAGRAARAEARRALVASGRAAMRYGRIEGMNRDFDLAFWQAQDTTTRLRAGWELVEHYLVSRGRADELRLQRSVGGLHRQRRPVPRRGRLRGDGV